ncbi:MAG: hypothetical protein M1503_06275 [Thaumarchaeota archaeon]|nr:hypothetical protein [Nitrososphaerota archaeon]MCL5317849.1 hypothetical protein [Nitrososphaerota archaeon]
MRATLHVALIMTLSSLLIFSNLASALESCYHPTGWFASEVMLDKPGVTYDVSRIQSAANVSVVRSSILYRSHYDDRVAVILTPLEIFQEKGLDMRLQLPTRNVSTTIQSIIYGENTTIRVADLELMGGKTINWILNLDYRPDPSGGPPVQVANITKDNLKLSIIPLVNETLPGAYIGIEVTNTTALSQQDRTDFAKIFDAIGYPQSFDTFIKGKQFKVISTTTYDLATALEKNWGETEWGDAMKTEIKWLIKNHVINGLEDKDIDTLSALAPYAWGEHNFKARWYNNGWVLGVTDEMVQANYTKEYTGPANCQGFQSSSLPPNKLVDFNTGIQLQDVFLGQGFTSAAIRAAIIGGAIIAVAILFIRRRRKGRYSDG